MSFQQRPNSGALFKNGHKKAENHPDYKGDIDVEGEAYELAAWLKKSKKGETFMSLSVKPKTERPEVVSQRPAVDPNDDIPF